jgi:hypothetical protein
VIRPLECRSKDFAHVYHRPRAPPHLHIMAAHCGKITDGLGLSTEHSLYLKHFSWTFHSPIGYTSRISFHCPLHRATNHHPISWKLLSCLWRKANVPPRRSSKSLRMYLQVLQRRPQLRHRMVVCVPGPVSLAPSSASFARSDSSMRMSCSSCFTYPNTDAQQLGYLPVSVPRCHSSSQVRVRDFVDLDIPVVLNVLPLSACWCVGRHVRSASDHSPSFHLRCGRPHCVELRQRILLYLPSSKPLLRYRCGRNLHAWTRHRWQILQATKSSRTWCCC